MTPLAYLKIGGAVAVLAATALIADANGANRVIARQAAATARYQATMQRAVERMNKAQDALARREGDRRVEVREIYREVPRIIDRPVYRTVAIDDDGVLLLQRAAAAANGAGRPDPAAGAGEAAAADVHH